MYNEKSEIIFFFFVRKELRVFCISFCVYCDHILLEETTDNLLCKFVLYDTHFIKTVKNQCIWMMKSFCLKKNVCESHAFNFN